MAQQTTLLSELGKKVLFLYRTPSSQSEEIARAFNISASDQDWINQCRATGEEEEEKALLDSIDREVDEKDFDDGDEEVYGADVDDYSYLNNINNSLAYWREENKRLLAYIRQLGLPHLSISITSAETDWFPVMQILYWNEYYRDLTFEEFNDETKLTPSRKRQLVQGDLQSCMLHFYDRFKELLLTWESPDGPFRGGNNALKCFTYRFCYQENKSPQVRCLVWLENAPCYWRRKKEEKDATQCVEEFIDSVMTCNSNTRLSNTRFKKYQTNEKPDFPMDRTRILEPEKREEDDDDHHRLMKDRFDWIRDRLSSTTTTAAALQNDMTFDAFLSSLNLTLDQYLRILRAGIEKPTVFLKRDVKDMYINPYNPSILNFMKSPMDIRYVLELKDCAPCMYISKRKDGWL